MYYYNQERKNGGLNYLTPVQKLLKLELEAESSLANSHGQVNELLTSIKGRSLTIHSNHFVTELVK